MHYKIYDKETLDQAKANLDAADTAFNAARELYAQTAYNDPRFNSMKKAYEAASAVNTVVYNQWLAVHPEVIAPAEYTFEVNGKKYQSRVGSMKSEVFRVMLKILRDVEDESTVLTEISKLLVVLHKEAAVVYGITKGSNNAN